MEAHLYQMAQSAFELQLHRDRDFPKCKTILEGWDGQQFFWQKVNKATLAEHFGVTMEDLRAEWGVAKRLFQKNRAAELSRDRTAEGVATYEYLNRTYVLCKSGLTIFSAHLWHEESVRRRWTATGMRARSIIPQYNLQTS